MKVCKTCFFVTLTYDEEHVPRDDETFLMVLDKRDVQLFFKRLRKKFPNNGIRYFLCGEYGPKDLRPHYHALIWNLPEDNSPKRIKTQKLIESIWQQGGVYVGEDVSGGAINYCAKYCLTPSFTPDSLPKPFLLTSRRPGLGSNYVTAQTIKYHQTNNLVVIDGTPLPLPRFYKNKVESREVSKRKYYENEKRLKEEEEQFYRDMERDPVGTLRKKLNEQQAAQAYEVNMRRHLRKTRKL